ncbi:hypothetical protein like AT1G70780 [Hibiscus trionum]|uniref:DUF7054 domain-containing protein n=1 Tax=Hibiscus trionum TaxID=183268 RepID=A0A9W7HDK3_HIBTR|nr:hypothetical protein like AT1G70780 [Hibiscus trionum]
MLLCKQKKNRGPKGNRLLVSITVLGSAGPIRFVVNEEQLVADVIDTALKAYAREGRLPVLGSDIHDFLLHCPIARSDALSPWEAIGLQGSRNFLLCKKQRTEGMEDVGRSSRAMSRKGTGNWKAWIHKSFSIKISSH